MTSTNGQGHTAEAGRLDDASQLLWDETQEDWHIEYQTILTEPVCAYISIVPDEGSVYPSLKGYIGRFRDDPDRDMADAVAYLLKNIRSFKQSEEGRAALSRVSVEGR